MFNWEYVESLYEHSVPNKNNHVHEVYIQLHLVLRAQPRSSLVAKIPALIIIRV